MKKIVFLLAMGSVLLSYSCRDAQNTKNMDQVNAKNDTVQQNILERTSKKMDSEVKKKLDKQIEEMGDSTKKPTHNQ